MKYGKRFVSALVGAVIISVLASTPGHASESDTGAGDDRLMTIGKNRFKSPETVVHDEKADVYLVSNVNGKLTIADDNGFISRVTPDGRITALKWIDGASGPDVVLHAPKDMLLTDKHLVVADVGAVRWFDRKTGKPVRSVVVPDSHMLNALAMEPGSGVLYVTDTGGKTTNKPGAIYRIDDKGKPGKIAKGPELDRPNGVVWHKGKLLVAPFGQHADHLYHVSLSGEQTKATKLPQAQLDGLLLLPDGSQLVTSWKGKTVYRIDGDTVEVIAGDIRTPAQIGHDAKRKRVMIPSAKENEVLVYPLALRE